MSIPFVNSDVVVDSVREKSAAAKDFAKKYPHYDKCEYCGGVDFLDNAWVCRLCNAYSLGNMGK